MDQIQIMPALKGMEARFGTAQKAMLKVEFFLGISGMGYMSFREIRNESNPVRREFSQRSHPCSVCPEKASFVFFSLQSPPMPFIHLFIHLLYPSEEIYGISETQCHRTVSWHKNMALIDLCAGIIYVLLLLLHCLS